MLRMLLMAVKLRGRLISETLKKSRKMLMEMKIVSLILCCHLGKAVCQGNRTNLGEKCSGMIRMVISLLRSWNTNQATLVIQMMRMQILAYVLLCRYHSVQLLDFVFRISDLAISSNLIFITFTGSVLTYCVKNGPKVLIPKAR